MPNPWQPEYIAGGSSGGSAVAVALCVGYASLGTDAADSVRMPASCCGLVGLKPTHGLVPQRGLLPTIAEHIDHIGPLTRSVADARAMLEVMAVPDPDDPHSSPRLALPMDIGALMPLLLFPMFVEGYVFHQPTLDAHPELYSPELRHQFIAGQYVLAQDYIRALRVRRLVIEAVGGALEGVDVPAMPTMPVLPLRIAAAPGDPVSPEAAVLLRNTAVINQSGHPAVSLPMGLAVEGVPTRRAGPGRPRVTRHGRGRGSDWSASTGSSPTGRSGMSPRRRVAPQGRLRLLALGRRCRRNSQWALKRLGRR